MIRDKGSVLGASPVATGLAGAEAPEPHSRLGPTDGIPSAVKRLRENAEALKAWSTSFDEHVRQANDPLFGRGYGIEERVLDLFAITARLSGSIYNGLLDAASAIEAAAAGETTQIGSTEGESATRQGDAQDQGPSVSPLTSKENES